MHCRQPKNGMTAKVGDMLIQNVKLGKCNKYSNSTLCLIYVQCWIIGSACCKYTILYLLNGIWRNFNYPLIIKWRVQVAIGGIDTWGLPFIMDFSTSFIFMSVVHSFTLYRLLGLIINQSNPLTTDNFCASLVSCTYPDTLLCILGDNIW